MGYTTVKNLPKDSRPYDKFEQYGPESLSDTELIAVILRSGLRDCNSLEIAAKILQLSPCNQGLRSLYHLSTAELQSIRGVGKVKAIQLKCIAELSKRLAGQISTEKRVFRSSEDVADYYMERLRHEEQECVFTLMLDNRNAFLGSEQISRGTVNFSVFSPRDIFLKALSYKAVNIVMVHNHPSGDPAPSEADIDATKRVADAGRLLGIELLDHIVIGDGVFTSLLRN